MMYDWCISDTHFFHDNIVKYAGRPENHVDLMVRNWKEVVKPEDTVLHLGDVLMGPKAKWQELPRLPGKVSVLSTGNQERIGYTAGILRKRLRDAIAFLESSVIDWE